MWASGGHIDDAIKAYKKCGHWREVLSLSAKKDLDMDQVAEELADDLVDNYRYRDGAFIYETYCKNYDEAIKYLTLVGDYNDAIRVVYSIKFYL